MKNERINELAHSIFKNGSINFKSLSDNSQELIKKMKENSDNKFNDSTYERILEQWVGYMLTCRGDVSSILGGCEDYDDIEEIFNLIDQLDTVGIDLLSGLGGYGTDNIVRPAYSNIAKAVLVELCLIRDILTDIKDYTSNSDINMQDIEDLADSISRLTFFNLDGRPAIGKSNISSLPNDIQLYDILEILGIDSRGELITANKLQEDGIKDELVKIISVIDIYRYSLMGYLVEWWIPHCTLSSKNHSVTIDYNGELKTFKVQKLFEYGLFEDINSYDINIWLKLKLFDN